MRHCWCLVNWWFSRLKHEILARSATDREANLLQQLIRSSAMSKNLSDKYLIKKIDQLKKSAFEHRNNNKPGQRRYWMHPYLKLVYEVFRDFRSKGISKKAAPQIVKLLKLPIRRKSHMLRVLIEASAGVEDNRTKIKWANALRYAFGWLQPATRLEWFFRVNGGIAGCAAKFAFLKAARRQRKLKKEPSSSDISNAQSASLPSQVLQQQIIEVAD